MKFWIRISGTPDGGRQAEVLDSDDRRLNPPSHGEIDIDPPVDAQLLFGDLLGRSSKPEKAKAALAATLTLVLNAETAAA